MRKLLLFSLISLIILASAVHANGLRIIDLTISRDKDSQRSLRDGDTYNELIEPGDDVEFEIEIENTFKELIDIEDIEIIIKINNITKGEDLIEIHNEFNLGYDRTKTRRIKIDIPDDADEIVKTVDISIKGMDENGTNHTIDWTIYLSIEDERHDVRIYTTRINQTTIDCSGQIKLTVWIFNDGRFDESNVVLEIENKELGIYKVYKDLAVDEDEKYTKTVFIDIDNVNKTGKFPLEIRTYYKGTHLDDVLIIDLFVNACKKEIAVIDTNGEEDSDKAEEAITEPEVVMPKDEPFDTEQVDKPVVKQEKGIPIFLISFLAALVTILIIIIVVWLVKNREF